MEEGVTRLEIRCPAAVRAILVRVCAIVGGVCDRAIVGMLVMPAGGRKGSSNPDFMRKMKVSGLQIRMDGGDGWG